MAVLRLVKNQNNEKIKTIEPYKKLITVKEFAKLYGFGLNYAYQLVNAKDFPMIRTGRKINILTDKVDKWLEENIGNTFKREVK